MERKFLIYLRGFFTLKTGLEKKENLNSLFIFIQQKRERRGMMFTIEMLIIKESELPGQILTFNRTYVVRPK